MDHGEKRYSFRHLKKYALLRRKRDFKGRLTNEERLYVQPTRER